MWLWKLTLRQIFCLWPVNEFHSMHEVPTISSAWGLNLGTGTPQSKAFTTEPPHRKKPEVNFIFRFNLTYAQDTDNFTYPGNY